MAVEIDQIWRRKPPLKERVRVERVWERTFNLLDEAFGYGKHGEAVVVARCHPLHGGKPLVLPVVSLESGFTLEDSHA